MTANQIKLLEQADQEEDGPKKLALIKTIQELESDTLMDETFMRRYAANLIELGVTL